MANQPNRARSAFQDASPATYKSDLTDFGSANPAGHGLHIADIPTGAADCWSA
jgi:hypothetical protein